MASFNLPPGCTQQDIEDAYGEDYREDLDEVRRYYRRCEECGNEVHCCECQPSNPPEEDTHGNQQASY